jgi:DMSO/TMAO reductase YedYZ heme-binding membrane subunit
MVYKMTVVFLIRLIVLSENIVQKKLHQYWKKVQKMVWLFFGLLPLLFVLGWGDFTYFLKDPVKGRF